VHHVLIAKATLVVAEISADAFNAWLQKTVGSLLLTVVGIFAIQHLHQSRRNQLLQYVGLAILVLGIFFVPETLKDLAVQIFGYFRG
jgi:uncharacterized membrane protein YqgA involved in biofilm formation